MFVESSGHQKGHAATPSATVLNLHFPFTIEMTKDDVTFFIPKFEHIAPLFDEECKARVLMPQLFEGGSLGVNAGSLDDQTHLFDEHCSAKTVRGPSRTFHS